MLRIRAGSPTRRKTQQTTIRRGGGRGEPSLFASTETNFGGDAKRSRASVRRIRIELVDWRNAIRGSDEQTRTNATKMRPSAKSGSGRRRKTKEIVEETRDAVATKVRCGDDRSVRILRQRISYEEFGYRRIVDNSPVLAVV